MDIAEFVAKFIEQENTALKQVLFAFLGYATLAVAGIVLAYKEYCKHKDNERSGLEDVPENNGLLFGVFVFAAFACLLLTFKYDGRKNFCIMWLPAPKAANADGNPMGHHNIKGATSAEKPSNCADKFVAHSKFTKRADRSLTDIKLITNFCEDYHKFDMGKPLPKHIETYLKEELKYSSIGLWWFKFFQKEWLSIIIFLLVFLSVDFYATAIRRICLRGVKAQTFFPWLLSQLKLLPQRILNFCFHRTS